VLREEAFADGFWTALQSRSGILVTSVTAQGPRVLRIAGLPSALPALRGAAAASAPSVASFVQVIDRGSRGTVAVAPVSTFAPWPVMLGVTASDDLLSVTPATGVLKLVTATAAVFGHLLSLERLTRLKSALVSQTQAMAPWLISEDDAIAAASPEAWRVVENLWRQESSVDLHSDFPRLPLALSSAAGLDLPIQLPGIHATTSLTQTDLLPPLLTITFSQSNRPGLDLDKLTEAERRVASLVLEGMSNREISDRLGRSILTIQNHVHSILGKLEASDRRELLLRVCHAAHPIPARLEPVDIGPAPVRHLKKPVA